MSAPVTAASPRSDREAFGSTEWLLFAAVGLIWGSSFLFIEIGLQVFHPGFITWVRVVLGALALVALPQARKPLARQDQGKLLVLSVVWVAVPFTLFPLAQEHINSAVTGLLNGATPFFAGIIGAFFFGRVPRGPQRLGIAVGFAGIGLVSLSSSAEGGTAFIGVLMALAATLCYGFATNLAGPIQQKYGSVPVMARMLVLGSIWTAPFGLVGWSRSQFAWGPAAAILALGVVGTGFAFAFMASLVGRVGGPRASFITYLIPIVSLSLGVTFLNERVAPLALLGVGLVLAAAVLASRREH
ncbi:MAG TPA: DMT family transporter [Acidimicrobiia bacterium]|nr:DMT family transporter [Acidimicrobiia bacterium]